MAKKARAEGVGVRESNLLPTKQALVRQFSVMYSVNKNRSKTSLKSFDYFTSRVKYMKLYCLISNAHYNLKVFCIRYMPDTNLQSHGHHWSSTLLFSSLLTHACQGDSL